MREERAQDLRGSQSGVESIVVKGITRLGRVVSIWMLVSKA